MLHRFPNGASGAVSLTYDDGVPAHLDSAAPDLESVGLRGTFFVPTRRAGSCLLDRADDWRALAARGHELGNHTQFHPCGKGPAWVKPNFSLEAYSLARMESELTAANRDLDEATGVAAVRTFAYPCGQSYVGPDGESFRPMAARLFAACRGAGDRRLIDPFDCDRSLLPAWTIRAATPLDDIFEQLDDAVERGRWAVLVFHGIADGASQARRDAGDLTIARSTHQAVVEYVQKLNRDGVIWCATFLDVFRALPAGAGR